MTDEEACARLYRDLCDASVRKDAEGIAAVLACVGAAGCALAFSGLVGDVVAFLVGPLGVADTVVPLVSCPHRR